MKTTSFILLTFLCVLKTSAQSWQSLDSLGNVYYLQEFDKEADSLFELAIKAYPKKLGKDSSYANILRKQAVSNRYLNKEEKSERLFLEAIGILKQQKYTGKILRDALANIASLYSSLRLYDKAISYYQEYLALVEQKEGKENELVANAYFDIGYNYYQAGKYEQAKANYLVCKDLRGKILGTTHIEYAKLLQNLGIVYQILSENQKAGELFLQALEIIKKSAGENDIFYAMSLNSYGIVLMELANYSEAASVLEKAASIYEFNRSIDVAYIQTCTNIGTCYFRMGDLKKAKEYQELCIGTLLKLHGPNHQELLPAYLTLAQVHAYTSQFERAILYTKEATRIALVNYGTKHKEYAFCLRNLANLQMQVGNYSEAESALLQALSIQEKVLGKNTADYASTCIDLGNFYGSTGNYEKEELLLKEALACNEKIYGKEHPEYAASLANLADMHRQLGINDKAEQHYLELIPIFEKKLGKTHLHTLSVKNNFSELLRRMKKLEQAKSLIEELLVQTGEHVGKESELYIQLIGNYAKVYKDLGQNEQALSYFVQAKDLAKKLFNKDHAILAYVYNNLGVQLMVNGSLQEAENEFLTSMQMYESLFGPKSQKGAFVYINLGDLYYRMGKKDKAFSYLMQGAEIQLNHINKMLPLLSEKERYQLLASSSEYFEQAYILGYEYIKEDKNLGKELYDFVLQTKSMVFNSTLKLKQVIQSSQDSSLMALYQEWKTAKISLLKMQELGNAAKQQHLQDIQALQQQVNDLEKKLGRSLPANFSEEKAVRWQDIKASLKTGEVAIEIIRIPENAATLRKAHYLALLLSANSETPDFVAFDDGEKMEKNQLQYYRNALSLKMQDKSSYGVYWQPIAEKLNTLFPKGIKTVFFSADGVYSQISLASLYNPNTKNYLLNEIDIHLLGNTKDLLNRKTGEKQWKLEQSQKEAALFGYPIYNAQDKELDQSQDRSARYSSVQDALGRDLVWNLLPGTKKEVESIEALLKSKSLNCQVHLGEKAKEEELKKLQNPVILHIATHGYFVQKKGNNVKNIEEAQHKEFLSDALKRCGLALAGCSEPKSSEEDGFLTAEEALTLHLEGTELVVLSACETGLGEVLNGEGVFGLQRSFQQAGAKTIVMSLWKVADEATQELMEHFYANLAKGKSKRDAFLLAQRKLKEKYAHPYYWAAFVMLGE